MSKRVRDSDDDQVDDSPQKSQKTTTKKSEDDVLLEVSLSSSRKLKVKNWRNAKFIDIREYYEKNGEELPGKKGISLSQSQWKVLIEHAEQINAALEK